MSSSLLCEICRTQPATLFITRVENGHSRRQSLCEACARTHSEGEAWLQSIAKKYGLPQGASLDDVMDSLASQPHHASQSDLDIPDLILEAELNFSGEFPSDEDAADDLAETWENLSSTPLVENPFDPVGEISVEQLKEIWQKPEYSSSKNADKNAGKPPEQKPEPARELLGERCSKCGTTWDRLREDGRAGCAKCYQSFHDRLAEIFSRLQRAPRHVGKTPRAAQKRHRRLEHLRARRDHRLEMLNSRLQAALAGENYEDAAELRDKIRIVSSTIVSDE